MKTIYVFGFISLFLLFSPLQAQLTTPQASPMAKVMQRVGLSDISVWYHRPSVNDREVWGKLVPYGFNNLGFGTATFSPWRAGANENTVFYTSKEIKVQGEILAAGKYGLHMVLKESGKVTLIFSKNTSSWGSYFYDEAEDALRVETQWEEAPHKEQLQYEFNKVSLNSAELALRWEKKKIPMQIETNTHADVIASFEKELRSSTGFQSSAWNSAAAYCLRNKVYLTKGLAWADAAINAPFVGQKTFANYSTKAAILMEMGKDQEARSVMAEALPLGQAGEIHQYGRQLIASGNKDEALKVFQKNAELNPNTWPVHFGLARGYSAKGEYKKALKHAKIAQKQVPEGDQINADNLKKCIDMLAQGKDIN